MATAQFKWLKLKTPVESKTMPRGSDFLKTLDEILTDHCFVLGDQPLKETNFIQILQ